VYKGLREKGVLFPTDVKPDVLNIDSKIMADIKNLETYLKQLSLLSKKAKSIINGVQDERILDSLLKGKQMAIWTKDQLTRYSV